MEIYPYRQFLALLSGFSTGLLFGVLWELQAALRVVIGAYVPPDRMHALYGRPLPFLPHGIAPPAKKRRRPLRALLIFSGDVLYCLLFSVAQILLLYHFEDGASRPSVLIVSLGGLALFRALTARHFARVNAYLAYFLAVLYAYIKKGVCLPFRLAFRLIRCCLLAPLARLYRIIRQKRLCRISAALCRAQLLAAARGLLHEKEGERSDVEKKNHADAMDHSHPHRAAVLRGAFRGLRASDGMERAASAKGSAGKRKSRA